MVETKRPECREHGADGQTWPFLLSSPPGSPKTYLLQLSKQDADQHWALPRIPLNLLVQGPPPHAWAGRGWEQG